MTELAARAQREREAWNRTDIVKAMNFKRWFLGAFENPHGWKLEAARAQIIRDRCRDAVVLDYGCWEGLETRRYLEYGARYVYGIDIADKAIECAKASLAHEPAEFLVADAHFLPFDPASFDLVVGRGILHHLDLKIAYAEIARVLKPGGLALFVEPLRGNPLSKLIRLCTPRARTPDERPLGRQDIHLGEELIGSGRHRFSGFLSAPLGAAVTLCGGSCDNWFMRLLAKGDEIVDATPLKYWGRLVYLQFEKPGAIPNADTDCPTAV